MFSECFQRRAIVKKLKLDPDAEGFFDPANDLRSVQRITTQIEEVVFNTHALNFQDLAPDGSKFAFGWGTFLVQFTIGLGNPRYLACALNRELLRRGNFRDPTACLFKWIRRQRHPVIFTAVVKLFPIDVYAAGVKLSHNRQE